MTRAIVPDRNPGRDDAKTGKPRVERPVQGDRPPDILFYLQRPLLELDLRPKPGAVNIMPFEVPRRKIRFPEPRIKLTTENQELKDVGIKPSFTREQGLRFARACDVSLGL